MQEGGNSTKNGFNSAKITDLQLLHCYLILNFYILKKVGNTWDPVAAAATCLQMASWLYVRLVLGDVMLRELVG